MRSILSSVEFKSKKSDTRLTARGTSFPSDSASPQGLSYQVAFQLLKLDVSQPKIAVKIFHKRIDPWNRVQQHADTFESQILPYQLFVATPVFQLV